MVLNISFLSKMSRAQQVPIEIRLSDFKSYSKSKLYYMLNLFVSGLFCIVRVKIIIFFINVTFILCLTQKLQVQI